MSDQNESELISRMIRLEGMVLNALERLHDIETDLAVAGLRRGPRPVPPPFIVAPPQAEEPTPTPPAPTAEPDSGVEYKIGAKVMPRIGAAMVLLAVLFFVVWRYEQGLIPPAVIFAGEVVFCLAFAAVGLFKRNEREDFGQVLMAIGSSGLYLTFAAGHLVHHLYSAEVLVALFYALSFVNLAVSLWRSSISFLAIGVLCGFVAAMLPLEKSNYALNAALHFGILAPGLAIAWRNRWLWVVPTLWTISSLALIPFLGSALSWTVRDSALMASTFACLAVFANLCPAEPSPELLYFSPIVAAITGSALYALNSKPVGGFAELIFAALVVCISPLACQSKALMRLIALSGFALALFLAPHFLPDPTTDFVYLGLAVALTGVLLFKRSPAAVGLAVTDLALGLTQYAVYVANQTLTARVEMTLIAVSIVAVAACATAARRAWPEPTKPATTGVAVATVGVLVARAIFVVLTLPKMALSVSGEVAAMIGIVVVATAVLPVGAAMKDRVIAAVGCLFVVAGACVPLATLGQNPQGWPEVIALAGLLGDCGLAIAATRRAFGPHANVEAVFAGIGWFLFTHVAYLLPFAMHRHANASLGMTVAWIIYGVLTISSGFAFGVPSLRYVSFVVFTAAIAKALLVDMASMDPAIRVGIFLAIGLALLAGGYLYIRLKTRLTDGAPPAA